MPSRNRRVFMARKDLTHLQGFPDLLRRSKIFIAIDSKLAASSVRALTNLGGRDDKRRRTLNASR